MEISNDDLARILGRIEGKLDAQAESSKRLEAAIGNVDDKLTKRLDRHEERIRALENGAAKAGVIAGVGSSVAIAALIELLKRKMGL